MSCIKQLTKAQLQWELAKHYVNSELAAFNKWELLAELAKRIRKKGPKVTNDPVERELYAILIKGLTEDDMEN